MTLEITPIALSRLVAACQQTMEQSAIPGRPNLLLAENVQGNQITFYALSLACSIGLVFPHAKPQIMRVFWREAGKEWKDDQAAGDICVIAGDRVLDVEGSRSKKEQLDRLRVRCNNQARKMLNHHHVVEMIETRIQYDDLTPVEDIARKEPWSSFLLDELRSARAELESKALLKSAPSTRSSSSRSRL